MATIDRIQRDTLALSVGQAVAAANEAAVAHGIDPQNALVTISEDPSMRERLWRIHYGPRDFVNRRGGDFIVLVDQKMGEVKKTLRGQ